jgi:hypothetical protein
VPVVVRWSVSPAVFSVCSHSTGLAHDARVEGRAQVREAVMELGPLPCLTAWLRGGGGEILGHWSSHDKPGRRERDHGSSSQPLNTVHD